MQVKWPWSCQPGWRSTTSPVPRHDLPVGIADQPLRRRAGHEAGLPVGHELATGISHCPHLLIGHRIKIRKVRLLYGSISSSPATRSSHSRGARRTCGASLPLRSLLRPDSVATDLGMSRPGWDRCAQPASTTGGSRRQAKSNNRTRALPLARASRTQLLRRSGRMGLRRRARALCGLDRAGGRRSWASASQDRARRPKNMPDTTRTLHRRG